MIRRKIKRLSSIEIQAQIGKLNKDKETINKEIKSLRRELKRQKQRELEARWQAKGKIIEELQGKEAGEIKPDETLQWLSEEFGVDSKGTLTSEIVEQENQEIGGAEY